MTLVTGISKWKMCSRDKQDQVISDSSQLSGRLWSRTESGTGTVCVCVSVADTCVDYTLYPVRQLTPVSLEYEEHVNVFVSGSAVFLMLFVCYLVESWTHLAPDIQSMWLPVMFIDFMLRWFTQLSTFKTDVLFTPRVSRSPCVTCCLACTPSGPFCVDTFLTDY